MNAQYSSKSQTLEVFGEVITLNLVFKYPIISMNSQGSGTNRKKTRKFSHEDLKYRHISSALLRKKIYILIASSTRVFKRLSKTVKVGTSATNRVQKRAQSNLTMSLSALACILCQIFQNSQVKKNSREKSCMQRALQMECRQKARR